jgi:hypothetical protein
VLSVKRYLTKGCGSQDSLAERIKKNFMEHTAFHLESKTQISRHHLAERESPDTGGYRKSKMGWSSCP